MILYHLSKMFLIFLTLISSKVSLGINDERQFISWMRTNNQFYIGSEYHFRLGIFLTNIRYIQTINQRKGLSYRLGVNKFTCYTPSEYQSLLGIKKSKELKNRNRNPLPISSLFPIQWIGVNVV